jgi:hypothetical protein
MVQYAGTTVPPATAGIPYCTAAPLPSAERDLYSAAPVRAGFATAIAPHQEVQAVVEFTAVGPLLSNASWVVMQGSVDGLTWLDLAWCSFTATSGTATYFLNTADPRSGKTANAVQQVRAAGQPPLPLAGSNAVAVPDLVRFVGQAAVAASSYSSSSGGPGQPPAGVTVTIRYSCPGGHDTALIGPLPPSSSSPGPGCLCRVVFYTTLNTKTASTEFTIARPLPVNAGDILYMGLVSDAFAPDPSGGDNPTGLWVAPPEWRVLDQPYPDTTRAALQAFWKVASNEPFSYTFTNPSGFEGSKNLVIAVMCNIRDVVLSPTGIGRDNGTGNPIEVSVGNPSGYGVAMVSMGSTGFNLDRIVVDPPLASVAGTLFNGLDLNVSWALVSDPPDKIRLFSGTTTEEDWAAAATIFTCKCLSATPYPCCNTPCFQFSVAGASGSIAGFDCSTLNGTYLLYPAGPCKWTGVNGSGTVATLTQGLGVDSTLAFGPAGLLQVIYTTRGVSSTPESGISIYLNCGGLTTMQGVLRRCPGLPNVVQLIPCQPLPPVQPSGASSGSAASAATVQTTCCPGVGIPAILHATYSGGTGTCTCLNGQTVALVNNGGVVWQGAVNPGCNGATGELTLTCSASNFWNISCLGGCAIASTQPTSFTCSPLSLTFNGLTVQNPVCCTGTVNVTVTP